VGRLWIRIDSSNPTDIVLVSKIASNYCFVYDLLIDDRTNEVN